MAKLTINEKKYINNRKEKIIQDCITVIRSYNISDSEEIAIINILKKLTKYRIVPFESYMKELDEYDLIIKGIMFLHDPWHFANQANNNTKFSGL